MELKFSSTAQKALQIMEDSLENLFLTGKAGTGKSTLLDHFRKNTKKRVAILAPTGVAAVNVEGETIHSFFGLKPNFELDEVNNASKKPKNARMYERLETIVIDEISMVRSDLLDAIDIFLRNAREIELPFGGVQMIFIGDLYQLPPVVTREEKDSFALRYRSPFFFDADVFASGQFEMDFIELDKIYRQNDDGFIQILNSVRNNTINELDVAHLNQRFDAHFEPEGEDFIYLMTTNREAKIINESKLAELPDDEIFFEAKVSGDVKANQFPADTELKLKIGAQIMFLNNDSTRRWVNGTIGKVTNIDDVFEVLEVELTNGERVEVQKNTWDISKYVFENGQLTRKLIGDFQQFPLRLAWAITIHKSQGKTFEKVIIDMGRGSFAHGQTYVALSRCRTLEGIVFRKRIQKSHVIMDSRVRRFLTEYQYHLAEKEFPLEEKIEFLQSAVEDQRELRMVYLKGNDERFEHTFVPICIKPMQFKGIDFLGMKGKCLENGMLRTFSVKRILEIDYL